MAVDGALLVGYFDAGKLRYAGRVGTSDTHQVFHVWPSRLSAVDCPDRLIVDLDPAEGTSVAELRTIARRARDLFDELGLTAFVQATGGRGFHVVTPLDATTPYDDVLAFARELADHLAGTDPERLTTAQRKEKRGDRVFLDVNRNGYAQTFVAPYTVCARPGAAVATPLDWSELGSAEPDHWHPATIRRRLSAKKVPWAQMDKAAAKLATRR